MQTGQRERLHLRGIEPQISIAEPIILVPVLTELCLGLFNDTSLTAGFTSLLPGFDLRSFGIFRGRSGTGAGFLRVLRFPLPILIPANATHSSSSIIWGWYNRSVSG
jgi:hypothetical protein